MTVAYQSEEVAPFLPWEQVYAKLRADFRQGDHVTVIGPTGAGKTHIALQVAELRTYVLFLACKRRDPLIADLRQRGYYETSVMEVPYVDGKPVHTRVVYWPRFSAKETKDDADREREMQSKAMRKAFAYAHKNGGWALVIDEGTWVCRDLKLQRVADAAWFQGRTDNVSVIMCAQRPAWVGQYALSMADHLFLFQTAHKEDAKSLRDIAGVDGDTVRAIVQSLDRKNHEVLYISPREGTMIRTTAPPR